MSEQKEKVGGFFDSFQNIFSKMGKKVGGNFELLSGIGNQTKNFGIIGAFFTAITGIITMIVSMFFMGKDNENELKKEIGHKIDENMKEIIKTTGIEPIKNVAYEDPNTTDIQINNLMKFSFYTDKEQENPKMLERFTQSREVILNAMTEGNSLFITKHLADSTRTDNILISLVKNDALYRLDDRQKEMIEASINSGNTNALASDPTLSKIYNHYLQEAQILDVMYTMDGITYIENTAKWSENDVFAYNKGKDAFGEIQVVGTTLVDIAVSVNREPKDNLTQRGRELLEEHKTSDKVVEHILENMKRSADKEGKPLSEQDISNIRAYLTDKVLNVAKYDKNQLDLKDRGFTKEEDRIALALGAMDRFLTSREDMISLQIEILDSKQARLMNRYPELRERLSDIGEKDLARIAVARMIGVGNLRDLNDNQIDRYLREIENNDKFPYAADIKSMSNRDEKLQRLGEIIKEDKNIHTHYLLYREYHGYRGTQHQESHINGIDRLYTRLDKYRDEIGFKEGHPAISDKEGEILLKNKEQLPQKVYVNIEHSQKNIIRDENLKHSISKTDFLSIFTPNESMSREDIINKMNSLDGISKLEQLHNKEANNLTDDEKIEVLELSEKYKELIVIKKFVEATDKGTMFTNLDPIELSLKARSFYNAVDQHTDQKALAKEILSKELQGYIYFKEPKNLLIERGNLYDNLNTFLDKNNINKDTLEKENSALYHLYRFAGANKSLIIEKDLKLIDAQMIINSQDNKMIAVENMNIIADSKSLVVGSSENLENIIKVTENDEYKMSKDTLDTFTYDEKGNLYEVDDRANYFSLKFFQDIEDRFNSVRNNGEFKELNSKDELLLSKTMRACIPLLIDYLNDGVTTREQAYALFLNNIKTDFGQIELFSKTVQTINLTDFSRMVAEYSNINGDKAIDNTEIQREFLKNPKDFLLKNPDMGNKFLEVLKENQHFEKYVNSLKLEEGTKNELLKSLEKTDSVFNPTTRISEMRMLIDKILPISEIDQASNRVAKDLMINSIYYQDSYRDNLKKIRDKYDIKDINISNAKMMVEELIKDGRTVPSELLGVAITNGELHDDVLKIMNHKNIDKIKMIDIRLNKDGSERLQKSEHSFAKILMRGDKDLGIPPANHMYSSNYRDEKDLRRDQLTESYIKQILLISNMYPDKIGDYYRFARKDGAILTKEDQDKINNLLYPDLKMDEIKKDYYVTGLDENGKKLASSDFTLPNPVKGGVVKWIKSWNEATPMVAKSVVDKTTHLNVSFEELEKINIKNEMVSEQLNNTTSRESLTRMPNVIDNNLSFAEKLALANKKTDDKLEQEKEKQNIAMSR